MKQSFGFTGPFFVTEASGRFTVSAGPRSWMTVAIVARAPKLRAAAEAASTPCPRYPGHLTQRLTRTQLDQLQRAGMDVSV